MSIATLPLSPIGPAGYDHNIFIHLHKQGCVVHNNIGSSTCHISVLLPVRLVRATDFLALSAIKYCFLKKSANHAPGYMHSYFASTMASTPTVTHLRGLSGLAFSYSFLADQERTSQKQFPEIVTKQLLILLSHIFNPGTFDIFSMHDFQRICDDYDKATVQAAIVDQITGRTELTSLRDVVKVDKMLPTKLRDITKQYFESVLHSAPFIVLVTSRSNAIPLILQQAITNWCSRPHPQSSSSGSESSSFLQGEGLRRGCQVDQSYTMNKPLQADAEDGRVQMTKMVAKTPVLFVHKDSDSHRHTVDIILTSRRYLLLNIFDITLARILFQWLIDGNRILDAIIKHSNSSVYLAEELKTIPLRLDEFFVGKYYHLQIVIKSVPILMADILTAVLSSPDLQKDVSKYISANTDSFISFMRRRQAGSVRAYAIDPHAALLDEAIPYMISFFALNVFNGAKMELGLMLIEDVYGPLGLLDKAAGLSVTLYDIWERNLSNEQDIKSNNIDQNPFLYNYSSTFYIYNARAACTLVFSNDPAKESTMYIKANTKDVYKRRNSVSVSNLDTISSRANLLTVSKVSGHGELSKEYSGKMSGKQTTDILNKKFTSTFIQRNYECFCFTLFAAMGAVQRVSTIVMHCHESVKDTMNNFIATLFAGCWTVTLIGDQVSDFSSSLADSIKISMHPNSSKVYSNIWFYYLGGSALKFQALANDAKVYQQIFAIQPFDKVSHISAPLAAMNLRLCDWSTATISPWKHDIVHPEIDCKYIDIANMISKFCGFAVKNNIVSVLVDDKDMLNVYFGQPLASLLISLKKLQGAKTEKETNHVAHKISLGIVAQQKYIENDTLIQHISHSMEITDDSAVFALKDIQSSIVCASNAHSHTSHSVYEELPTDYSFDTEEDLFKHIQQVGTDVALSPAYYLPKFLSHNLFMNDVETTFTLKALFSISSIISSGFSVDFMAYLHMYLDILNSFSSSIVFTFESLSDCISITLRAESLQHFLQLVDILLDIIHHKQLSIADLEFFNMPGSSITASNILLLINSIFMGQAAELYLDIHLDNYFLMSQPQSHHKGVVQAYNLSKQHLAHLATIVALSKLYNFTKALPSVLPSSPRERVDQFYSTIFAQGALLNRLSLTFCLKKILDDNSLLHDFLSQDLLDNTNDLRAYLLGLTVASIEYVISRMDGVHSASCTFVGGTHAGMNTDYAILNILCTNPSLSDMVSLFFDEDDNSKLSNLMKEIPNNVSLCLAIRTLIDVPNLFTASNVQHLSALLLNYYKGFPAKLDIFYGKLELMGREMVDAYTQHFTPLPATCASLFKQSSILEYLHFASATYKKAAIAWSQTRLDKLHKLVETNQEASARIKALLASDELTQLHSTTSSDTSDAEMTSKLEKLRAYRQLLEQQLRIMHHRNEAVALACHSAHDSARDPDVSSSLKARISANDSRAITRFDSDTCLDSIFTHNPASFLVTAFNVQLEKRGIYTINGFPIWFKHLEMNVFPMSALTIGLNITHTSHSIITKKHDFYGSLPFYVTHLSKKMSQLYIQETALWYAMHLQKALSLLQSIPLRHELQLAGMHSRILNTTIGMPYPIGIPVVHGCNVYFHDPQSTVSPKSIIKGHYSKLFSYTQDTHGQTVEIVGPVMSLSHEAVGPVINFQICAGMLMENFATIAYYLDVDISLHAGLKPPSDPAEYMFYLYRDCLRQKHGLHRMS